MYYSPHTLEIKKLPALSADLLAGFFNADDLKVATTGKQLEKMVTALLPEKKNCLALDEFRKV